MTEQNTNHQPFDSTNAALVFGACAMLFGLIMGVTNSIVGAVLVSVIVAYGSFREFTSASIISALCSWGIGHFIGIVISSGNPLFALLYALIATATFATVYQLSKAWAKSRASKN